MKSSLIFPRTTLMITIYHLWNMSQTFYFSQGKPAVKLISLQNTLETAIFKQEVAKYFLFCFFSFKM